MSNSMRYQIGQTFLEVVAQVAVAQSAVALFNPRLPVDVKGRGSRILFVLDRGDRLKEQPAQKEKRIARIVVGALALTETADLDVDTLHFAARTAIKFLQITVGDEKRPLLLREVEIEPELKENTTDGALLLSAYEIDYYQPYPEPPRA